MCIANKLDNVAEYSYDNLTDEISVGYPFQDFEFLGGAELLLKRLIYCSKTCPYVQVVWGG